MAEAYLDVGRRKLPPASEAVDFFDNAATQLKVAKEALSRLRAINSERTLREKFEKYIRLK